VSKTVHVKLNLATKDERNALNDEFCSGIAAVVVVTVAK
jgi:hypothetical protein